MTRTDPRDPEMTTVENPTGPVRMYAWAPYRFVTVSWRRDYLAEVLAAESERAILPDAWKETDDA